MNFKPSKVLTVIMSISMLTIDFARRSPLPAQRAADFETVIPQRVWRPGFQLRFSRPPATLGISGFPISPDTCAGYVRFLPPQIYDLYGIRFHLATSKFSETNIQNGIEFYPATAEYVPNGCFACRANILLRKYWRYNRRHNNPLCRVICSW